MAVTRMIVSGCFVALLAAQAAQAERVDLELVLAADVSGSMDADEARLQRQGYRRALRHPALIRAITAGPRGKIAVTYVEWAGPQFQHTLVDWTVIKDAASARGFAANIRRSPLVREYFTSISGAIAYALKRFDANPHRGARRVLDISGDGPNNTGISLAAVRKVALDRGIVINGLPIVAVDQASRHTRTRVEVDHFTITHYAKRVIGGPGSFMIVARGIDDFGRAIRAKLIKEIAWRDGRRQFAASSADNRSDNRPVMLYPRMGR